MHSSHYFFLQNPSRPAAGVTLHIPCPVFRLARRKALLDGKSGSAKGLAYQHWGRTV